MEIYLMNLSFVSCGTAVQRLRQRSIRNTWRRSLGVGQKLPVTIGERIQDSQQEPSHLKVQILN